MLSCAEFAPLIKEAFDNGLSFLMPVKGQSMLPYLYTGDQVSLINDKNIKKHDMIFYLRDDGHYVLHRVYAIKDGNYVLVGDNQTYLEYPIRPDQVIGKVEYIVKKGKRKDLKGFFYRFYLWIWHSLFIRKCCLKIYRSFRREK